MFQCICDNFWTLFQISIQLCLWNTERLFSPIFEESSKDSWHSGKNGVFALTRTRSCLLLNSNTSLWIFSQGDKSFLCPLNPYPFVATCCPLRNVWGRFTNYLYTFSNISNHTWCLHPVSSTNSKFWGPCTSPCGTPLVTSCQSENNPFMLARCFQLVSQ